MADNVTVQSDAPASAAAGTVFAFDEIAGVKHARSKTGFGADGSYTDVSASDPLPVVQTGTPSLPTGAANSAVTSVADTASSTTLLSSSGSRKGFRITNTSSAVLYVKYGTTASASDFTVRLPQWAYLEENFYSGRVDGIWASDPGDGAALITSLSA